MKIYVDLGIKKAQAESLLCKPSRFLARKKKIIKVDLIYLPYYVFSVSTIFAKNNTANNSICVDGAVGIFSFYKELNISDTPETPSFIIEFTMQPDKAMQLGCDQFRRILLRRSLKKRCSGSVENVKLDKKIFYPYWVGYFQRGKSLDFVTIDGVSGCREGPKMRPVFMYAFLQKLNKNCYYSGH